eukprot:TRINITY_DN1052_c0_g1_i1.p1 TRINITY_DN1052_c0_g1~~TRINITY_DN1052_c0_g1_i1.p1  ORF type:complete len:366 (+),score=46.93 TRINITY_DN1052_c0_g1_i1:345-1442(+)
MAAKNPYQSLARESSKSKKPNKSSEPNYKRRELRDENKAALATKNHKKTIKRIEKPELIDKYRAALSWALHTQTQYCPEELIEDFERTLLGVIKKNFLGSEELTIDKVKEWLTLKVQSRYQETSNAKKNEMIEKHVEFSRRAKGSGKGALHLSRGVLKTMCVCSQGSLAETTWYSMNTEGHSYYLGKEIQEIDEPAIPGLCEGIVFEVVEEAHEKDHSSVIQLSSLTHDVDGCENVFYGVDPDTKHWELKTADKGSVDDIPGWKKHMFQIEAWLGGLHLHGCRVRMTKGVYKITKLPSVSPDGNEKKNLSRLLTELRARQHNNCIQRIELKNGKLSCRKLTTEKIPVHIQKNAAKIKKAAACQLE